MLFFHKEGPPTRADSPSTGKGKGSCSTEGEETSSQSEARARTTLEHFQQSMTIGPGKHLVTFRETSFLRRAKVAAGRPFVHLRVAVSFWKARN